MRIKKLMISGFGKLVDKEYELDDNMTLFFGENESGKSTLRDFILAMFFGMKDFGKLSADEDLYTKREPWDAEHYGGTMILQMEDRDYMLERNFDEESEKVKLSDIETGKEQILNFGNMSQTAYLSTSCLSQKELRANAKLENLVVPYLTNLIQTKSGEFDVKRSIEYIEKRREELSYEENQSKIDEIQERLLQTQKKEIELERLEEQETILKSHNMEEDLTEISQSNREKDVTINGESKISFYRILILGGLIFLSILSVLIQLYWFSAVCLVVVPLLSCIFYLTDRFCEVESRWDEQEKRKQRRQRRERVNSLLALQKQKEELKQEIYQKGELEKEYRQNKEEMQKILYRKKVLSLAEEKIRQAVRVVYDQFSDSLSDEVSTILEQITGKRDREVRIDEKLGILIREDNRLIRSQYLSAGTMEQIYFALRLAMAKLLFDDGNMPIIIDDIFGSFDSARLERTLDYLFLQKQQVIVFSSSNEVKLYFERKKRKIQYISE